MREFATRGSEQLPSYSHDRRWYAHYIYLSLLVPLWRPLSSNDKFATKWRRSIAVLGTVGVRAIQKLLHDWLNFLMKVWTVRLFKFTYFVISTPFMPTCEDQWPSDISVIVLSHSSLEAPQHERNKIHSPQKHSLSHLAKYIRWLTLVKLIWEMHLSYLVISRFQLFFSLSCSETS